MKSIKKNYILNLIYNIVNLLSPLIIAPYLSRVLGVDGIGIKSYTLSIVSNFIIIANLGIAEYGQREIAINADNKYARSKKLYELGILRACMTIVVVIIYTILFVVPIVNTDYNIIYTILFINILANVLDFTWFLQGTEEFKQITITQIITKFLLVIGTILLVHSAEELEIAIALNSMALLLNSIIPLLSIKKMCCKVRIKELKIFQHLKKCMIYFIPAIAVQVYTVMDKTMIGLITNSTSENGYYEQADKIVKIIISVVTTANVIMRSRMSYLYENKDFKKMKELLDKSLHITLILAIPIMFGIVAISRILVPVFFGNGYEKTVIILNVLAPLSIIIGLNNLIGSNYLTPTNQKNKSNIALIAGAITNFILNLILIPNLQSVGAAVASIVAEGIIMIIYIKFAYNIVKTKEILNISKNYIIASVIMFVLVSILKGLLETNIISLIIIIVFGAIVYGVVVLLLKDSFVYELIDPIKKRMTKRRS